MIEILGFIRPSLAFNMAEFSATLIKMRTDPELGSRKKNIGFLFSVVTVTLNNLDGLLKTEVSLKQQNYRNYQWIVVDGASTDGTVEYLKAKPSDNSICWLSEPDGGIYHAMNKGMKFVKGQFALFLNAGDAFASSNVLQRISKTLQGLNYSPALIYGDSWEVNENEDLFYKRARHQRWVYYGMFTYHQSMFFNVEDLDDGYDVNFQIAGDYALVARLFKKERKFIHLDYVVCKFQRGGLSYRLANKALDEEWLIRRDILKVNVSILYLIQFIKILVGRVRSGAPLFYDYIRYKHKRLSGEKNL